MHDKWCNNIKPRSVANFELFLLLKDNRVLRSETVLIDFDILCTVAIIC